MLKGRRLRTAAVCSVKVNERQSLAKQVDDNWGKIPEVFWPLNFMPTCVHLLAYTHACEHKGTHIYINVHACIHQTLPPNQKKQKPKTKQFSVPQDSEQAVPEMKHSA